MDQYVDRIRRSGLEAGWELFLPNLQPLIANFVREAIPRADAESAAAAAAIGHDRAFATVEEAARICTPTLVIAGDDQRHPTEFAQVLADVLPRGQLAGARMSDLLVTAEDMAQAFAPLIEEFLLETSP